MNRCTGIIQTFLQKCDVESNHEEGSDFLRFTATVKENDLKVLALVDEGFMSVRIYYPMVIDKTRRAAAAEFVCRASWPLPAGLFCLDLSTGRIAYSVSTSTPPNAEAEVLEDNFQTLMASVTSRMEAALGPLTKLASGRITPRQAVIQLEAEFNRQSTLRVPPELVDQETILVN